MKWLEHLPTKPEVVGSIPSRDRIFVCSKQLPTFTQGVKLGKGFTIGRADFYRTLTSCALGLHKPPYPYSCIPAVC